RQKRRACAAGPGGHGWRTARRPGRTGDEIGHAPGGQPDRPATGAWTHGLIAGRQEALGGAGPWPGDVSWRPFCPAVLSRSSRVLFRRPDRAGWASCARACDRDPVARRKSRLHRHRRPCNVSPDARVLRAVRLSSRIVHLLLGMCFARQMASADSRFDSARCRSGFMLLSGDNPQEWIFPGNSGAWKITTMQVWGSAEKIAVIIVSRA